MRPITVEELAQAVNGRVLCGDPATLICGVAIDSRAEQNGMLFVPIIGEKADAHRFIHGAFEHGAAATLTSRTDLVLDETHPYVLVEDTVNALTALGDFCRLRSMIPAVGVTGSVGKTTTREMIACALASGKRIFKTSKNYNSRIGTPITMTMLDGEADSVDLAVLEMGMNVPGELTDIARLARPEVGVVTNVGVAHIEFYGTKEKICEQKLSITEGFPEHGLLVLCGDDPLLYAHRNDSGYPVILYGLGEQNDYRAEEIRHEDEKTFFTMVHGDIRVPVMLKVPGDHHIANALAALAVCDHYGLDLAAAAAALGEFGGFQNRLQIFKKDGCTIIDDTYNASPDSFRSGLKVLSDFSCAGQRIAVLGDMFELGSRSQEMHELVGTYAAESKADLLVTIGENSNCYMAASALSLRPELAHHAVTSNAEAIAYLKGILKEGDVLYLKASNGMKLKEITAGLMAE